MLHWNNVSRETLFPLAREYRRGYTICTKTTGYCWEINGFGRRSEFLLYAHVKLRSGSKIYMAQECVSVRGVKQGQPTGSVLIDIAGAEILSLRLQISKFHASILYQNP